MNTTKIKCPNCNFEFPLEDALKDEVKHVLEHEKQTLRQEMLKYKEQQDEKYRQDVKVLQQKEATFQQKEQSLQAEVEKQKELYDTRLKTELQKQQETQREELRKTLSQDFENQIKLLQEADQAKDEKLKDARRKELEFLQKEQQLKAKEEELDIRLQRQLLKERESLKEQLRKEEEEKASVKDEAHKMQVKEFEKKLEDQKKLIEEMRRKSEQGSMQLQGEVQELALEEMLRAMFPFDAIAEVGKGIKGADVIQTVKNQIGGEAGIILYESKRTKAFSLEWVSKLKADAVSVKANVCVIVTEALPDGIEKIGQIDGVWICTYSDLKGLVIVLRDSILKISEAYSSQTNKGEKMQMLYDYLMSQEFRLQLGAIIEGFGELQNSYVKERNMMERLWKQREKQLEKVLLNTNHFIGSIQGIAGNSMPELKQIGEGSVDLELPEDV
ncbi:MAG: DUF2130 domain-containing protein [Paludibacteraceae bacterium]